MKKKKYATSLLEDKIIKGYIELIPPDLQKELIDHWVIVGKSLSEIINIETINYVHLAAKADVLYRKKQEDKSLYSHAVSLKNNYTGSSDLKKFLIQYKSKEILPVRISIDYKTLNKKNKKETPRSDEDVDTNSAEVLSMHGYHLVMALIELLADKRFENHLEVMAGFELYPPIDIKKYSSKKKNLFVVHAKNGCKVIYAFLKNYKLSEREVKLATMKTLAMIYFIKPYKVYKEEFRPSGSAKIKGENEYYLQRFTDLTKGET